MLIPEFRGSKLVLTTSSKKVDIIYNYRTKSGEKKEKTICNTDPSTSDCVSSIIKYAKIGTAKNPSVYTKFDTERPAIF